MRSTPSACRRSKTDPCRPSGSPDIPYGPASVSSLSCQRDGGSARPSDGNVAGKSVAGKCSSAGRRDVGRLAIVERVVAAHQSACSSGNSPTNKGERDQIGSLATSTAALGTRAISPDQRGQSHPASWATTRDAFALCPQLVVVNDLGWGSGTRSMSLVFLSVSEEEAGISQTRRTTRSLPRSRLSSPAPCWRRSGTGSGVCPRRRTAGNTSVRLHGEIRHSRHREEFRLIELTDVDAGPFDRDVTSSSSARRSLTGARCAQCLFALVPSQD